jgi:hypothetical protein
MYQNKKNWLVVGVLSDGQLKKISGPHTNTQVQSAHQQAEQSLETKTKSLDIPNSVANVKIMRQDEFNQKKRASARTRKKPTV